MRATNQTLHQTYQRAIATVSQLSNENASNPLYASDP
jgi:hypothetical protein